MIRLLAVPLIVFAGLSALGQEQSLDLSHNSKQSNQKQWTKPQLQLQRIVFLGDSITAGYGLEKTQAYPSLIQALAKEQGKSWKCVNAGLSGDTTSGGVRRSRILARTPYDIFVIALGGNDGLRGVKPEATKQNLVKIIETVRKKQTNAKILLVGIAVPGNMGKDYSQAFLKTFTEVTTEKSVALYENLIEGIVGNPEYNLPDMIHPNAKGHRMIAEKLYQKLHLVLDSALD